MANRRKFVKSIGTEVGIIGVAGCTGDDSGGGNGDSVTVPGIYDLSGATASVGRPTALGSQDALQWLENNDELQISIDHPNQDYAYEVPEAISAYESYTSGDKPPAILGWGSGDTKALAPEAARDEIVYISAAYAERLLANQFS